MQGMGEDGRSGNNVKERKKEVNLIVVLGTIFCWLNLACVL